MSFKQDKQGRCTVSTSTGTIDANTNDFLNGCMQMGLEWQISDDKAVRPTSHRCYDRVVRKFPTVAEYPTAESPIGSKFYQFEDDGGVTKINGRPVPTEFKAHVKVDALTIQPLTKEVRAMSSLAGTVLTDGAVVDTFTLHVDGLTVTTGTFPKGTKLTITPTGGSPTVFTVIEDAAIATNEADVILDAKITVADGVAVTVTSINALSTDTTILGETAAAVMTIVLPAAASAKGCILHFVFSDTGINDLTIDGDGAETIEGAATQVLNAQFESISIVSSGTAWFILTSNR